MATTKIHTPTYNAYDPEIESYEPEIESYESCNGWEHDPDGIVPWGALKEHEPVFELLWPIYEYQLYQSQGFDLDVFPGCGCWPGQVAILKSANVHKAGQIFKLANRAIQDYNLSSVTQYSFLAIEKANLYMTAYHHYYFMTLKVLNVTLGTPIETFRVKFRRNPSDDNDWQIFFCHPKEVEHRTNLADDSDWFLGHPEEEDAANKSSHTMAVAAWKAEDEYLKVGKKVCTAPVHIPSKAEALALLIEFADSIPPPAHIFNKEQINECLI